MKGTKAEIELDRLQKAIDAWEIGIFDHNHSAKECYGSPRMRELYGLTPDEELSVVVFTSAVFPPDVPMVMKEVVKAHAPHGDGRFDILHRIQKPDGKIRWIHSRSVTTFHIVDNQRIPLRTQGSIVDMTERHELELALQRQEERLTQATVD